MLEDYYVKPSTIDRVRGSWLALRLRAIWNGCKRMVTLALLCIAACRCFFTLPSSPRRRVAKTLLLARPI